MVSKKNKSFKEKAISPFLEMIFVKGGSFLMGLSEEAEGAYGDEHPVHEVRISSYYLCKYPVIQGLWEVVMNNNPSNFKGKNRPVERVSWNECIDFLNNLNKITGKKYRLPSEAEWEYAARGGRDSESYLYSGSDKLKDVGWYDENSFRETKVVGQKMSNELGFYDLSGNVWEWCEDAYDWHADYSNASRDGSPWIPDQWSTGRVNRGGSWRNGAQSCQITCRNNYSPAYRNNSLGLRLALSFSP